MKAGVNKVAVQMEKFYEDSYDNGDFKIYIHYKSRPTHHIKTGANIHALPIFVSEIYKDFSDKLSRSSRVYFDYKTLDENDFVVCEDGYKIYFVPIDMIFCSIEELPFDNEVIIHPNHNITLCEPYYGENVEEVDLGDGKKSVCTIDPKTNLLLNTNIKPDERIAKVFVSSDENLSSGDCVFREPKTNYEYEIEGKNLYVVMNHLIMGVVDPKTINHKIVDDVRDSAYKADIDLTKGDKIEQVRTGKLYKTS